VTHAELTSALPYDDNGWVRDVDLENRPTAPGKLQSALHLPVSSGYFGALRIPLMSGRGFDSGDTLESRPVAIVSERFVAQYFPAESPLGHRIRMGGQNSTEPWLTIVGVAKETNYSLWTAPQAAVYMNTAQIPPAATEYMVVTNGNPMALASAVRQTLAGIDPLLPLDTMESYAQLLRDNLTGLIYAASMLAFDALFALLLAAIGIFGVMAALVGERTREIGLRLAMGATRSNVLGMILRRAGVLTALGLSAGLVLAFALAQGAASLLRGVRPDDPLVFLTIPAAIALIAIGTSWIPAWRAASVDPMITLREE
jgi:putative ABC transport system permease protein